MHPRLRKSLLFLVLIGGFVIPFSITFFLTQQVEPAIRPVQSSTESEQTQVSPNLSHLSNSATDSADSLVVSQLIAAIPETISKEISQIDTKEDVILLTLTNSTQVILDADPQLLEIQLTRLELILTGFDFDSIDEEIVEIDVRYKLPVLRSGRTY